MTYERYLANEVERHAAEADEVTCPECTEGWDQIGRHRAGLRCTRCHGTGSIPADPSDGAADDAYERAIDREMGL